jgi:hypothetical protein
LFFAATVVHVTDCAASCTDDGATTRPASPAEAAVVARGGGSSQPLTFIAPGTGDVYLVDLDGGEVVFAYPLRVGQEFRFDPASARPTVDGQAVSEGTLLSARKLRGAHRYELRFAPGQK